MTKIVGMVEVFDGRPDLLNIEILVLLLVAQHLEWRLSNDGEIQCLSLRIRQIEHHLMRKRSFAAAREPAMTTNEYFAIPLLSSTSSPGTPVSNSSSTTLTVIWPSPGHYLVPADRPTRTAKAALSARHRSWKK